MSIPSNKSSAEAEAGPPPSPSPVLPTPTLIIEDVVSDPEDTDDVTSTDTTATTAAVVDVSTTTDALLVPPPSVKSITAAQWLTAPVTAAELATELDTNRDKTTATINTSLHATRVALEAILSKVPVQNVRSREAIEAQLEQMNSTLETVNATATSTLATIIDLQNTVAPMSVIRSNLDALTTKFDDIESSMDERFSRVDSNLMTCIRNVTQNSNTGDGFTTPLRSVHQSAKGIDTGAHQNDAEDAFNDDDDSDIDINSAFASAAAPTPTAVTPTPYGTPFFSQRGGPGSPAPSNRYPAASPLRSSSGGIHRAKGTADSMHERPNSGAVHWMTHSKGPYGNGVQKTFKMLSISLTTDGFDDFFRFYNGIITQLSLAGYHRRLLPSLQLIAHDADLCRSPVDASCMPISTDDSSIEWSQSAFWDEQHSHLSQLLYLTLTSKDVIKLTAPITLGNINRHSQHSNGFGAIQALIRRHHPRVALSTAPSFGQCLTLRPTLLSAKGSHPAYLSLYERWMDRMRLYLEYGVVHKPSQFSIWFIRGLSIPLRAQLKGQELILLRFQAHYRASTEPELLPETNVAELGQLLDIFAPETSPLEQVSRSNIVVAAATITNTIATATVAPPVDAGLLLDHTSPTIYEHYVAAFGGGPKRPSRSAQPSVPCAHAPCRGRSHPPDLCCICYAPHPTAKCWHLSGLPERELTRCKEFKAAFARGDGPKTKSISGIQQPGVTFNVPLPPVDTDVEEVQRSMLLAEAGFSSPAESYRLTSPGTFVGSIQMPVSATHLFATPADDPDMSLPALESLSGPILPTQPTVTSEAEPAALPPPGHSWWHLDTGATDFCTNRTLDLLAAIPTNQPMGTAATGATATVEAIGSLTLTGTTDDGRHFMESIPQAYGVPAFARRSCSLHGFKSLGYEAIHSVGNYLLLIHNGSGTRYKFSVTTMHGNTDFVAFSINAAASLPPDLRVSAINLATRLKGPALYYLLHFRFGCLAPALLDVLIQRGSLKGVATTLTRPDDFQCPICLTAHAQRVASAPGTDHVISIKGSRFHADFFFPNIVSIRGYVAVLLIVDPVTSHGWVFLRRSKHPPIQLMVWFITHLRRRLQLAFSVLRTDGGGELYGSPAFRSALAQIHCQTETTGGYNASANGPPETASGLIKRTMRCLLLLGGQEANYWCFAVPFSQTLENVRPRRKENFRSSHAGIHGKEPSYDHLRILFSMVYILVSRASRRAQDPLRRATPGLFLGYQGTGRVLIYRDDSKRIRYAHHAVIDELQSALDPAARNPAARLLHNTNLAIPFRTELTAAIALLEITPSRWSHNGLSTVTLPNLGLNGELGFNLAYSPTFCRCKIISLISDSPAAIHLQPRSVVNTFLLTINGATVRTLEDIKTTLDSLHQLELSLDGILLLLGSPSPADKVPEDTNFVPADGNIQRAVWSIVLPPTFAPATNSTMPTVASIAPQSSSILQCPSSFRHCMKGPFRQDWLQSLFTHLDSNSGYGTFAHPCVPPTAACILDTILVIKHKIDEYNRLVERKVRVCAHGGQQIAGLDYDESYAPAILATSFRLCMVLACHLGLWIFHLDVSNAFQSTVDHDPQTYLRCFPEYLLWFESRHPAAYAALRIEHPHTPAHEFAMLMHKYVQGRVDASRQWKHAIEEVLIDELGLVPNRADSCMYSGLVHGEIVIIGRATDDFLVVSTIKGYKTVLETLRVKANGDKRWKIHDYGLATFYFGIRIVQSRDAITIDQRPFSRATLADHLGAGWDDQSVSSKKHAIPLPAGTAYEARLAGEIPGSPAELKAFEIKFGFKFRTLLGKFMQLTSWTRVDLVTATIRLSQYQSSPGSAHFEALHAMLLYLRNTPDLGLTYTRKGAIRPLESHPDFPILAQVPVCPSSINSLHVDWALSTSDGLGEPVMMSHEPSSLEDTYDYAALPTMKVPRVASVRVCATGAAPTAQACDSGTPITVLTPPPTEGEMDANHGSVFETIGFSGVVLMSLGTIFYWLSQKQATPAYNTAESELYAATAGGKVVKWCRVWMSDMGLPFTEPIPMGEDNEATRIIGHAGKLTRNVRHIAIQTTELQSMVKIGTIALRRVGSADNRADHCTKLLPYAAFILHTALLMGLRFITSGHASTIARRNAQSKK